MAKHSFAFRDVVAARGRIVQVRSCCVCRACARWSICPRVFGCLVRRKINPLRTSLQHQDGRRRRRAAVFSAQESRNEIRLLPGCSARSTCAELNDATHLVAAKLGLELMQLDSATCTGTPNFARSIRSVSTRSTSGSWRWRKPWPAADDHLQHMHAERARRSRGIRERSELAETVNARLAGEDLHYSGGPDQPFSLGAARGYRRAEATPTVVNPLTGMTVAAFYGCHITRPPLRYGFVDLRKITSR